MKNTNFFCLIFGCLTLSCQSQQKPNEMDSSNFINRQPAVAGQFYPAQRAELENDLNDFFSSLEGKPSGRPVLAIISPHAGYVFSGQVAAEAFSCIDKNHDYDHIFVMAPSHREAFDGASVYFRGDYITPLGTVKVDKETGRQLAEKNKLFGFNQNSHNNEHSLEVQLPFLQHCMNNDFSIIPIIIGTQSPNICRQLAQELKPYLNEKNLFIISSDFSHYPDYEHACKTDKETASYIEKNNPDKLLEYIQKCEKQNIPGLATNLCGLGPVLTLLYMTENNPDYNYHLVSYKNSGDTPYGEKDRVVGYCAIELNFVQAVTMNPDQEGAFTLDNNEKKQLLTIARQTIEAELNNKEWPRIDESQLSPKLRQNLGAFVSLHNKSELRGCIGRFNPEIPLYKVVQEMVVAAATQDHRFSSVTTKELKDIDIEISVLTPMKKIKSIEEIELGRHGIYISKGYQGGTFLPQVANQTGWTREQFLGYCSRDKAGLGWDGWKDADVYIYEALVFTEHEMSKK